MENSKVNLLRSELNMASSYVDRLFHGIIDLSDLDYHPELKDLIKSFEVEFRELLEGGVFQNILSHGFGDRDFSNILFREWLADLFSALEMIARLGLSDLAIDNLIKIVNITYRLGRELHLFSLRETDLVVELPRTISSKQEVYDKVPRLILSEFLYTDDQDQGELEDDWDENTLPLYQVDQEGLEKCDLGCSILSFSMGTLKKSKELINKGHECVFDKKYSNALVFFEKSRRLHETAEVLTLIGWVYSLLENLERGKKFCLKAIEIDPDYGPAYNDIGSYLLQEGDINESVRWFNLAKNAPIYQNKEYPSINLGRAYLMQKKYRQALEEFKLAKKIAPHQQQISKTIEKIEKIMEPQETKPDLFDGFPLGQNGKLSPQPENELQ
tara:strand:- start:323 stop:1477 length:1155 start_codon:yes stop_codon:yes gene_type:complete